MKTKQLQTYWWDWLGTSERLLRVLHEQTAALTLRDVARVERIQPDLDGLLELMKEIDGSAAACAKSLAEELGTEPNLRSLVHALEKAEAQQVQQIANRVKVAANHIEGVMAKNQSLIENELTYVNGTLTLIAKTATEAKGPYTGVRCGAVLVDQAA